MYTTILFIVLCVLSGSFAAPKGKMLDRQRRGDQTVDCKNDLDYYWIDNGKRCYECQVWGDPHTKTFDGLRFTFDGVVGGTYVAAESEPTAPCSFRIEVELAAQGATTVIDAVSITTTSNALTTYSRLYDGNIQASFGATSPWFSKNVGCDMIAKYWEGGKRLSIAIPVEFAGHVRGICGWADGNKISDWIGSDGIPHMDDPEPLVATWAVIPP